MQRIMRPMLIVGGLLAVSVAYAAELKDGTYTYRWRDGICSSFIVKAEKATFENRKCSSGQKVVGPFPVNLKKSTLKFRGGITFANIKITDKKISGLWKYPAGTDASGRAYPAGSSYVSFRRK